MQNEQREKLAGSWLHVICLTRNIMIYPMHAHFAHVFIIFARAHVRIVLTETHTLMNTTAILSVQDHRDNAKNAPTLILSQPRNKVMSQAQVWTRLRLRTQHRKRRQQQQQQQQRQRPRHMAPWEHPSSRRRQLALPGAVTCYFPRLVHNPPRQQSLTVDTGPYPRQQRQQLRQDTPRLRHAHRQLPRLRACSVWQAFVRVPMISQNTKRHRTKRQQYSHQSHCCTWHV